MNICLFDDSLDDRFLRFPFFPGLRSSLGMGCKFQLRQEKEVGFYGEKYLKLWEQFLCIRVRKISECEAWAANVDKTEDLPSSTSALSSRAYDNSGDRVL